MNAPLRRVAISVLVLFTLLIVNVNYIQVVRAEKLRENPSNTRVLTEEYDRERGSIIVDGNEVALSVPTEDRLRYLRTYPEGELYAAGHRVLLAHLQQQRPWSAPRTTSCPATTRGCSCAGSPTCSPGATRPAATSS